MNISKKSNNTKQLISTIKSWFEKDENGKTNKVAITIFFALLTLPIVIVEGIKVGLYEKYSISNEIGFNILLNGLNKSFLEVLQMENSQNFGLTSRSFNTSWLVILLFTWGIIFGISFIMADRYKNRSNKKDGAMSWACIKQFNKDFAYPQGADESEEPPEDTAKREGTGNDPGNMILSEHIRYSLEPKGTNTYSCACIVGATGSGKSFTYVKPNILQMNCNYIVTDPKGELAASCGKALMEHGYDVRIFNISEAQYSCRYNPFHYIYCPQDVVTLVDTFIKNTDDPDAGSGEDQFFSLAVQNFFTMLFYYIYTCCPPEEQTFKTVYEMYLEADEPETKSGQKAEATEFDKKFLRLLDKNDPAYDPTNPCLPCYQTFKKGTAKTKQSILISVGVRLGFMSTPEIANLLSGDDLHLETMSDRKSALFAIIPAEKKDFNFLAAMMFTQLFNVLYRYGNVVNEKSWLLTYGDTVALRSDPFIPGTQTEETEKEILEKKKEEYANATIEDDNELMKTDPVIRDKFSKPDENGFIPWPCCRLVYTDPQTKKKTVLEEFKSKRAAEIVKEAAEHGTIHRGNKSLHSIIRVAINNHMIIPGTLVAGKGIETVLYTDDTQDCYVTVNAIRSANPNYISRKSENVYALQAFFLDLDTIYHQTISNMDQVVENTTHVLARAVSERKLLPYTIRTNTGRGMGLYFVLRRSIAKTSNTVNMCKLYDFVYDKLFETVQNILTEANEAGIETLTLDPSIV